MIEPTVMDLTVLSHSFPVIQNEVERPQLLDTIEQIFARGTDVIILEGEDGIGKTFLLAQFAKRFPHNTISAFITNASKAASDPEIIKASLYEQVVWALEKKHCTLDIQVAEGDLRLKYHKLSQRPIKNNQFIYFIIDGIDEFPLGKEKNLITEIIELVPFGKPNFKFLLAGDLNDLSSFLTPKLRIKTFPVSSFSPAETAQYLKDIVDNEEMIEEIHRFCRIPEYLSSFRRNLDSGIEVSEMITGDKRPLDFFEIEWRKVKKDSQLQQKILALITHNEKKRTLKQISEIIKIAPEEVQNLISDLTFLETDTNTAEIGYKSEVFRKFAAKKLKSFENEINNLLIASLFEKPQSLESLLEIPSLLNKTAQYEDLLNLLSPDHFSLLLEHSSTLTPLKQQAFIGVETALKIGKDKDVLRLSLQLSSLEQLADAETWRAEIEARAALGDFDGAFAIAQNIILKEERFHALSVIARFDRERSINIRSEIETELRVLYEELDIQTLGDKAIEIASDLIFSMPELAMQLVERAANMTTHDNALDWALTKFTISAFQANTNEYKSEKISDIDPTERLRSTVKDPEVQKFIESVSLLFRDYSGDLVIKEAEKSELVGDKLFLLRQWTRNNRGSKDAIGVVNYALQLAIGATDYNFNATLLRELATPLPYIEDVHNVRDLIPIFDSQRDTVLNLGPTQDFVRLQLLLARTEAKYHIEAAYSRLIDVYYQISYLDDLDLSSTCFAWFLGALKEIDPDQKLEDESDHIHSETKKTFDECVRQLLEDTASHFELTEPVIKALAKFIPDLAENIALSLNTEIRRNKALLVIYEAAVETSIPKINLDFLYKLLDKFTLKYAKDSAIKIVVERLQNITKDFDLIETPAIKFFTRINEMDSSESRVRNASLAYKILMTNNPVKYSETANDLLDVMNESWNHIDTGWRKVTAGFEITTNLAKVDQSKAHEMFLKTEDVRKSVHMDVGITAQSYILSLKLAIRAFKGLLQGKKQKNEDFLQLKGLIDVISSRSERARLYADIAVVLHYNHQNDDCEKIVKEKLQPLLDGILDKSVKEEIITEVAPALYLAFPLTAIQLVEELPQDNIDDAIENICMVLLTKDILSDPFEEGHKQSYKVDYEDILKICTLLEKAESDIHIFKFVKAITDTLATERDKFKREQRGLIASKLQELIKRKLPHIKNIRHEGYKIISQSQINTIQSFNHQDSEKLLREARALGNVADRVFVLAFIADNLPKSEKVLKNDIFIEAKELIPQITAPYDRINRYQTIAELTIDTGDVLAKNCLQEAFNLTVEQNDPYLMSRQRKIVDLAFRIDPTFAKTLAMLVDDDPAKKTLKNVFLRRLETLKLEKRMSSSNNDQTAAITDRQNAPEAAWEKLGALNSGKISHLHNDNLRPWIRLTYGLPLFRSYSIFAWFIQNAVKRFRDTADASSLMRPIFDATIQNCKFSGVIASRSSLVFQRAVAFSELSTSDDAFIVEPRSRDEILAFLKGWFLNEVKDYLYIADPYFGIGDLQLIRDIGEMNPACKICILTSRKHNEKILENSREAFLQRWKATYNDDVPDVEIVIAGVEPIQLSPIHDRWWVTDGKGLRVGTSYNSLGLGKISEISKLSAEDAFKKELEISRYFSQIKSEHNGKQVNYKSFKLK